MAKTQGFYIYGMQPVIEALNDSPKTIIAIYTESSPKEPRFEAIRTFARKLKIPVNTAPDKKMKELVGDVNHQGVIALLKEFPYHDIATWMQSLDMDSKPAVLLLDEIQDTHNLGAIIRTAAAFNFAGVLVSKDRQAPVNSTVFKTSAGAAFKVPIVQVGNINQTLELLKDKGFWVAGLDMYGEQTLWNEEFTTPMVFVVGSEGKGVGEKTLEKCDYRLSVPMSEQVESLNVSVVTALVAYEWARQKSK